MIAWLTDTLLYTGALIALVLVLRRPVARHFGAQMSYALWALPLLREGDVAVNYGHWLGLRGLATLLPLGLGVMLLVLALNRSGAQES